MAEEITISQKMKRVVGLVAPAKHVVVVPSKQPSLDELAAAIGLVSLLNKGQSLETLETLEDSENLAKKEDLATKSPDKQPSSQKSGIKPPAANQNRPGVGLTGNKTKVVPGQQSLISKNEVPKMAAKNSILVLKQKLPPALNFLKPDEICRHDLNSYRDLIFRTRTEKVDKIRYSHDEDVVDLIVSPFRSAKNGLSLEDFEIKPGDYNIDVVIALGASSENLNPVVAEIDFKQETGPKLITINNANTTSTGESKTKKTFVQVDLVDPGSASICEMVYDLAKQFGVEIDDSIASSLLTGLFSATDRFASEKAGVATASRFAEILKFASEKNKSEIVENLKKYPYKVEEIATNNRRSSGSKRLQSIQAEAGNKQQSQSRSRLGIRAELEEDVSVVAKDDRSQTSDVLQETVVQSDGTIETYDQIRARKLKEQQAISAAAGDSRAPEDFKIFSPSQDSLGGLEDLDKINPRPQASFAEQVAQVADGQPQPGPLANNPISEIKPASEKQSIPSLDNPYPPANQEAAGTSRLAHLESRSQPTNQPASQPPAPAPASLQEQS